MNHGMVPALPAANTVLNHDIRAATRTCELKALLGASQYPGRALGLTRPGDIIQLHPALRPGWEWITRHYAHAGLTVTKDAVWDDSFTATRELLFPRGDRELSVFLFGEEANGALPQVRPDWLRVVRWLNSKNFAVKLARHLSVPTPKTWCFKDKGEVDNVHTFPYPCRLKSSVSVSGLGIVRCDTSDELASELSNLDAGVAFQVQEELPIGTRFLNVQYWAYNNNVRRGHVTEQILDGTEHAGNCHPIDVDPQELVTPMATWMWLRGMRGPFAFDIAAVPLGDGRYDYLMLECNPRFNGATYPSIIGDRVRRSIWSCRNYRLTRELPDIDLNGVAFNPKQGEGAIVVNWGPSAAGEPKAGIMIVAQDHARIPMLEEELRSFL